MDAPASDREHGPPSRDVANRGIELPGRAVDHDAPRFPTARLRELAAAVQGIAAELDVLLRAFEAAYAEMGEATRAPVADAPSIARRVLSPGQGQILEPFLARSRDREIAKELGISVSTVKADVASATVSASFEAGADYFVGCLMPGEQAFLLPELRDWPLLVAWQRQQREADAVGQGAAVPSAGEPGAADAETATGSMGWPPLTAREKEVRQLLADGRTDREIAFTLGWTFNTARSYSAQVRAKLGVRSRRDLRHLT